MKKIALFVIAAVFSSVSAVFAQSNASNPLSARQICDKAMEQGSPQKALTYLENQLENVKVPEDKRALYAYLGNLQEMLSMYSEAQRSYATAAGIAAGDAPGLPKKSSEALVIDAVRCALCAGESETALSYLNSAVRNSKSEKIQAQIKLYEQWARLSIAQNLTQTIEAEAMLKVYLTLSSMEYVKPQILLTLWYITGEKKYSSELQEKYPQSAENAVASGKAQILPTPFWFFLPRKALLEEEFNTQSKSAESTENSGASERLSGTSRESTSSGTAASGSTNGQETSGTTTGSKTASSNSSAGSASENSQNNSSGSASNISADSTGTAGKQSLSSGNAASSENVSAEKNASGTTVKKLQLGLFRDKNNALGFVERVQQNGFASYIQEEIRQSGTVYYLVIVDDNADGTMSLKLKSAGFESYPIF